MVIIAAAAANSSPPARGAWIEIRRIASIVMVLGVAPRTGGVD